MTFIRDHAFGLMHVYIHRADARTLSALRAGICVAVDLKNTDEAEPAQQGAIGAKVAAPEVADENRKGK